MHSNPAATASGRRRASGFLHDTFIGTPGSRQSAGRGRTAVLNQLMLCVITLVVAGISLFIGDTGNIPVFLAGAMVVFGGGVATLVVPWTAIARGWIFIVPLVDVAAIALMRYAEPTGGLGLLWAFPAIWLAALGTLGYVAQVVIIPATYWWLVAVGPAQTVTYASVLLPAVILAIATTMYVSTRRYQAQQSLLDTQATVLSGALQRAQRQEELVHEVLDAVDFGVLRVSPEGTVAVVNEALGRFQSAIPGFGSRDRELENAYRFDGTSRLPRAERPLIRALHGEVFDNQIVWFGHPDERRHALSFTVRRMRDTQGADAGAVLIARDVTAEMTALRARDRLVSSVSHELRTPLTSVLGYIDLALDSLDRPEHARASLEVASRNGERLLEIVADILAASSASRMSIDMTVSPEDVDVGEVLGAAAEAWRARAALGALTIDTAGIEAAHAFADPLRLRQVLDNLISNAVKYNRDGGEIALGCTSDGTTTWILVRDTGSGIAEDDLDRLFERYFRARTDVDGTGLGLSISRDIARALGGDITVRSARGVGSTFILSLPVNADGGDIPAPSLDAGSSLDDEEGGR